MDTTKRERYISITGHEPKFLDLMVSRARGTDENGKNIYNSRHYHAYDNSEHKKYSPAHQLVRAFRIACITMYFVGLAKSEKETA